ncbi:MAG TPA: hypothetical protein VLT62_17725 [Candidatus Methylomirabilis sp.]|nr:hypothetical protein [Candidatus Methylomirabilis sp.]
MSSYKVLMAVIAMACLALSGCSVIMAASTPGLKDMNVLVVGTPRADVLKEFGEPAHSGTRDGKRVDTFKYRQGEQDNQKYGRAALHAGMDLITLGIWEIVGTPAEIISIQPRTTIEVAYDEQDRVELIGPAGIYWAKAGSTKDDLQRDSYDCRQASRPSTPGVVVGPYQPSPLWLTERPEYQAENLYRECMRARGYELYRRQADAQSQAAKQP